MEAADVRIKGERRQSPRNHSTAGTVALCVIVTLSCTALFVCIRWRASRRPPMPLCSGVACEAYTKLLGDITNRSVSPCHDFHDYVCTRRRRGQPLSGKEHAIRAFREHVVTAAEELVRSGDTPSPVALAAARLYKACDNIVVRKKAETEELRKLLADVGSQWPNLESNPDLLNLVVRLSAQARWDMPLQIIADNSVDDAPVVRISPSRNFETVMRIRERLLQLQRYESHYNLLRGSLFPHATDSIPFVALLEIEKPAVSSLKRTYLASASKHSVEFDLSNASTVTPCLTADRWNQALSAVFGELAPVARLHIENLLFVKAVFALNEKIGERYSSWFISWCAVVFISSMTNADAIMNAHSSYDEALQAHRESCFNMAHNAFGYAFYAPHVEDLANPNARIDLSQISARIRSVMGVIATGWVREERVAAFVASDPQKLLKEVFKSSLLRLQAAFASYTKMTGSIMVDWRLAMEGLDRSTVGDVRPHLAPQEWQEIFAPAEGSYQVTVMPYAMEIPLYHVDAPLSLKYAGLGFQVAVALSAMLFSNDAFVAHKARSDEFVSGARCLEAEQASRHRAFGDSYRQLLNLISLKTAWMALNSLRDSHQSGTQSRLAGLTEEQAFFVIWCYTECGTSTARHFCSELLRHAPEFSRSFGCKRGEPMSACFVCSAIPGEQRYVEDVSDLCPN